MTQNYYPYPMSDLIEVKRVWKKECPFCGQAECIHYDGQKETGVYCYTMDPLKEGGEKDESRS